MFEGLFGWAVRLPATNRTLPNPKKLDTPRPLLAAPTRAHFGYKLFMPLLNIRGQIESANSHTPNRSSISVNENTSSALVYGPISPIKGNSDRSSVQKGDETTSDKKLIIADGPPIVTQNPALTYRQMSARTADSSAGRWGNAVLRVRHDDVRQHEQPRS